MRNIRLSMVMLLLMSIPALAQITTIYTFAGTTNGQSPQNNGSLYFDGTYFYGTTLTGGANNDGTIYRVLPNGTGYLKLLDFAGTTNGSQPACSLISDGTYLYGMTSVGGINNMGTIFKILPNGTGYTKLLDFAGATNGNGPQGSLYYDGTYLYGMTQLGGINTDGVIFKILPNGTGYTKLLDFNGTNGNEPFGNLISDGTYLYGMTNIGGVNNAGVIFKIKPNGTSYTKLLDFAGATNGQFPFGNLYYDGTYMYGMTPSGGTSNFGTIFKILPNGTGYVKLLDFNGTNGHDPNNSLISDGTYLYGTTTLGGANGYGLVFKILPNGTGYVDLGDFTGAGNGRAPYSSLYYDGSASLYGTTLLGGANGIGTVYKLGTTSTLPVQLLTFTAVPDGEKVDLSWETATEEGNAYFTVERSSDGINFISLVDVPAAGSGTSHRNYTSTDQQPFRGTSYYRLKQTDYNSQYKYSDIVTVNFNKQQAIIIYPNPAQNTLQITGSNEQFTQIQIIDMLGEEIMQATMQQGKASIDISALQPGLYFVKTDQVIQKFIKQ